jgi:alkylated DNA repair protein alkB family protein 8
MVFCRVISDYIQIFMLMLYNVLRVSRCLYQSPEALSLLTLVHSLCHSEIFSTVREVNIKGASSLSTLVCDGESQIPQSQTVSSLSVKSNPEIEKKYVHHVYDAIAPHFSST